MKKKIQNVKEFVQNHDRKIVGIAGLVVGAGGTFIAMRSPHVTDCLHITTDQLQGMLSDPKATLVYELPKQTIHLRQPH